MIIPWRVALVKHTKSMRLLRQVQKCYALETPVQAMVMVMVGSCVILVKFHTGHQAWDQNLFKDVLKIGGLSFNLAELPPRRAAKLREKRLFLG